MEYKLRIDGARGLTLAAEGLMRAVLRVAGCEGTADTNYHTELHKEAQRGTEEQPERILDFRF